jgi:hypothetical protein
MMYVVLQSVQVNNKNKGQKKTAEHDICATCFDDLEKKIREGFESNDSVFARDVRECGLSRWQRVRRKSLATNGSETCRDWSRAPNV